MSIFLVRFLVNICIIIYNLNQLNMKTQESHNKKIKAINYGDFQYWEQRYSKKKGQRFEWLETYSRLKPFIESCLPKGKDSIILNIGCGNSCIQEELYEQGYHKIYNNDISSVVIQEMRESQKQKGMLQMFYDVMDARKMTYPSQHFDLIIDKSTIDTMMCSQNPLINVAQMVEQGYRLVKEGGFYLTISYSDDRMVHFKREHVNFELQKRQLKHVHEEGHEVVNHLYICKKIGKQKLTVQKHEQFYANLKQLEQKEYPPA